MMSSGLLDTVPAPQRQRGESARYRSSTPVASVEGLLDTVPAPLAPAWRVSLMPFQRPPASA